MGGVLDTFGSRSRRSGGELQRALSSLREGPRLGPPDEVSKGMRGPRRMSGGRGGTHWHERDLGRDLSREVGPAGHATGGMKGVPDREGIGLSTVSRLYPAVQLCDATVWTRPLAWRENPGERRGIPS